ncbi:hypothetical protein GGR57DRAFT_484585 [Xylariaceae sp. FL1272]|nr:hypothetical protein GGR57DRAFT_484585 [Xylariaceae sp. FL1272]
MALNIYISILVAASCFASAANNSTSSSLTATPTATEPCGILGASWASQISATASPTVEASIAYECLNSIPIAKDKAIQFLDEIVPYLEWQVDSAYKKDPPPDYFFPGYDIFGEVARIRAGVVADDYPNEYSWQVDLYLNVIGKGHDGHFDVVPDVLSNSLVFARQWALVSISEDGNSLPVIKVYDDMISSPDTASVVQLIDNIDASTYLQDWIIQMSSARTVDAAYNSLFFSKAMSQTGSKGYFLSQGRIRFVYPGPNTTLTFENGTEVTLPNLGILKGDWSEVTDASSFIAQFAPGMLNTTSTAGSASVSKSAAQTTRRQRRLRAKSVQDAAPTAIPGYPEPVIISEDTLVSGYFLSGNGFEDVAVLALTSFSPDDPPTFQAAIQDFLELAVSSGMKKLVVDVQMNGGGHIFQGYDAFRQLFPDIVQNGTGRWRASPGFLATAEAVSTGCADYDPLTSSSFLINMCESVFNYRYDLNVSLQNFQSFDEKFGPYVYNGDNFTNVFQWNLSNPLDTSNATFGEGYNVTGYNDRTNFTRPFGGPENIVLLFDGFCASTCSLFAQFLKWDAGVQSIAVGGLPQVGPMQGVGGVKGAQDYDFSEVLSRIQRASTMTNDTTLLAEFGRYTSYPMDRADDAHIGVKDEILPQNLLDGTPAQYVAEYSDCRLYFTADMHEDITNLWKAAASAAFNGGDCAYGSINSTARLK